jgi:hypothetical protein
MNMEKLEARLKKDYSENLINGIMAIIREEGEADVPVVKSPVFKTPQEIAILLGCCKNTVFNMIRGQDIPKYWITNGSPRGRKEYRLDFNNILDLMKKPRQ